MHNLEEPNLDQIKAISGDDEEFIIQLLEIFVAEAPIELELINAAFKQEEWKLLAKKIHKIKSKVGVMNLQQTRSKLSEIESSCNENNPSENLQEELKEFNLTITNALMYANGHLNKLKEK